MKKLKCCLCGGDIAPQIDFQGNIFYRGHNAQPLSNGRCCDTCNYTKVLPARMNKGEIK